MSRREFFKKTGIGLVGIAAIPFVPWEPLRKGWVGIGAMGRKTVIRSGFSSVEHRLLSLQYNTSPLGWVHKITNHSKE